MVWQLVTSLPEVRPAPAVRPAAGVGRARELHAHSLTDPPLWAVVVRSIAFCVVVAAVTVVVGGCSPLLMQRGQQARADHPAGLPAAGLGDARGRGHDRVDLALRLAPRPAQLGCSPTSASTSPGHNWLDQPLSSSSSPASSWSGCACRSWRFCVYAGLTQVSDEVIEAAQLDGASVVAAAALHHPADDRARCIIDRPLLQLIWDLRVFTQIKMLQDAGGADHETNLLGTSSTSWERTGDFGMSARSASSCWCSPLRSAGSTCSPDQGGVVIADGRSADRLRRHVVDAGASSSLAVLWAFPVYWMLNSSLLPNVRLQSTTPPFFPSAARSTTSRAVLADPAFGRALGISLGVTLIAVFVCHRLRLPRRAGDQPVPVPRPGLVRARAAAHPDAARRGPVHRAVQDDVRRSACSTASIGAVGPLHRGRHAVHDLDAARLRRRGADRARGGGDGRRPVPHPGLPADHLPAAGPGPRRLRRLRVPAGLERVHRRAGDHDRASSRRPCRCGCAASSRPARPARPTGARSWPPRRWSPCP